MLSVPILLESSSRLGLALGQSRKMDEEKIPDFSSLATYVQSVKAHLPHSLTQQGR